MVVSGSRNMATPAPAKTAARMIVVDIHVGIKIGAPIESKGKGQEAGGYEAYIDFIAEPAD